MLAVTACPIFLPYAILTKATVSRAWAQPLTWDNFTLANFSFTFFEYSATQSAIVNTLELGVMTACVGAGLVALLSYAPAGSSWPAIRSWRSWRWLRWSSRAFVLAVGLFIAYTRPPLLLYGTLWILFIAYLTKEMPVGSAQSDATFRAIPPDLEDAGRILGGGRLRVLRDITAPWPGAARSRHGASSSSASFASCRPRSSCSRRRPR